MSFSELSPSIHDTLPAAVDLYIRATNAHDLDALLDTFADDALVNDQLHDHWGRQQILQWAQRDIIGESLTIHVIASAWHYGHIVLTASVDGMFEKRGLPDPLILTFYFSLSCSKIVQLIILRNQSGT
jgi:hypothetical protein